MSAWPTFQGNDVEEEGDLQYEREDEPQNEPPRDFENESESQWRKKAAMAAAATAFGIPPPLTAAVVGGLPGGRKDRKSLPKVSIGGQGIQSARVDTESGSAKLGLSSPVPTMGQFRGLEQSVNQTIAQGNTTQRDVAVLSRRVDEVVIGAMRSIARVRREQRSVARWQAMTSAVDQVLTLTCLRRHTHDQVTGRTDDPTASEWVLVGLSVLTPLLPAAVQLLVTDRNR